MLRKEEEQRQEELRQQRIQRYEATGRFVAFLQDKMTEFVNLDLQKKILSYHGAFDAMELFRLMDKDNNGYLTAAEFVNYFSDDEDFNQDIDFDALIRFWNSTKEEDKLSFNDFQRGVTLTSG